MRLLTGKPVGEIHGAGRNALEGYQVMKIGLIPPRAALYERIDARVLQMIRAGWVEEVRRLIAAGFPSDAKPFQVHRLFRIARHLESRLSEEDAVKQIQQGHAAIREAPAHMVPQRAGRQLALRLRRRLASHLSRARKLQKLFWPLATPKRHSALGCLCTAPKFARGPCASGDAGKISTRTVVERTRDAGNEKLSAREVRDRVLINGCAGLTENRSKALVPASADFAASLSCGNISRHKSTGGKMNLKNTVALITGGSSGIGRAIAQSLAASGSRVAITGRDEKRLAEAARELGVHPIHADVSVEADVERTYREMMHKFGDLDILVNNAGVGVFKNLVDFSLKDFESVFATNVTGAMLMAREAAKHFIKQQRGNIVNISSTAGLRGAPNGTAYYASKFALRGMTECWRAELRKYNIRVILMNPKRSDHEFLPSRGAAAKPQRNETPRLRRWPTP